MGHFQKVCRKAKVGVSSTVIVGAINEGRKSRFDNRKFLKASINGRSINWLIDSGSEVSIVSQTTARVAGIVTNKSTNRAVTVDGSVLRIVGESQVVIQFQEGPVTTKILIADRLSEEAILGMNTLNQFQAVVLSLPGSLPPLKVASVAPAVLEDLGQISDRPSVLNILPVSLFTVPISAEPVRVPS